MFILLSWFRWVLEFPERKGKLGVSLLKGI